MRKVHRIARVGLTLLSVAGVLIVLTSRRIVAAEARLPDPDINAEAAIAIDRDTGEVLWDHRPDRRLAMASTTKIMTALIAIEHGDLDRFVTVGYFPTVVGGACLSASAACADPLQVGERLTLRNLLYGMIFTSGNNAAQAVAEHIVGRQSTTIQEGLEINGEFVGMMNRRARADDLRLWNTRFVSPHGRDPEDLDTVLGLFGLQPLFCVGIWDPEDNNCGHYSTARDLATLGRVALDNPTFAQIVKTKDWPFVSFVPDPGSDPEGESGRAKPYNLGNGNLLLRQDGTGYPGANGVKSGSSGRAGQCLVSSATLLGKSVIGVVLGSREGQRWRDTEKLLDNAFDRLLAVNRLADSAGQAGDVQDIEVASYAAGRVVTAVRDAAGDLKLITWRVRGSGGFARLHDSGDLAGAVTEIALAALDASTVVTAVRDSHGNLKLITWSIDALGRITRPDANGTLGAAGRQISVVATSASRIVTAIRDASGRLNLTSWSLNSDASWSILDDTLGAAVFNAALTAYCLDCGFSGNDPPSFRLLVATRALQPNPTPGGAPVAAVTLTAWSLGPNGELAPLGSAVDLEPWGNELAVAYDRFFGLVVTAGRNGGAALQLTTWSISADGLTVQRRSDSQAGAGPAVGTARQIRLASVPGGGVVIALRDAAGDLKLVVWGMDGIGLLRRLDDSDTQAGAVARVALAPHSADRYVTAVESSAGTLKLIDWHIR